MADHDLAAGIAADLLGDAPLAGIFGDEAVVLVRHDGKVCVLSGTCPHAGAPLAEGIVVDGELRCPWHHARFDIATGAATAAPAFDALARFRVVEEDGRLRVTGRIDAESERPDPIDIGRVVIVGGGAAGHALAHGLARAGAGAAVTILSDDGDPPYDRTVCSKDYLAGKLARDETALPPLDRGLRTGVVVTRLDLEARMVELTTGERIAYDTLVLATGCEAVVPEFDGDDRDDVFVLRTLADAEALIDAAGHAGDAVVIGSSFVGLEAAASLRARGLGVAVVAEDGVPLAGVVGPELGAMIRTLHEDEGVTFHLGREVRRWDGHAATLDDGTRIEARLLVAGTGVRPRLDLARDAGLALAEGAAGGGVAVDATLRTSARHVYAIGDIASVPDPRLGRPIRVEHWVVAQRMAEWLARHLTGGTDRGYRALPFFWSGQYDFSLRYVGHAGSVDDRTVEGTLAAGEATVTVREGGVECALATVGRDRLSLETEAAWEGAAQR